MRAKDGHRIGDESASSAGFSLLEVMIAIGVMAIGMYAMMSFQLNQSREMQGAGQVLAKLDAERVLSTALANGSVCTFELAGSRVTTFDTTTLPATATMTPTLATIHSSADASAPALFSVQGLVSPHSTSLKVQSITVEDINGVYPNYMGNLVMAFELSNVVRALKPIRMPIRIVASGAGSVKTVTSCSTVGPVLSVCPAGQYAYGYDSLGVLQCAPLPVAPSMASCPAGLYATGYDAGGVLQCGAPVYQ